MTLTELDLINQLLRDRGDLLDALNNSSRIDFTDEDAEVFPEVEQLLQEIVDTYQQQKKRLLHIEADKIENTLKEKYNLDLTPGKEYSN